VAENLPQHPKVKGLSAAASTEKGEMIKKDYCPVPALA
jgi:hypothetical protein